VGPERKMSVMWTRGPRVCTTPPVENCRKKEQPARYEWGKKHPLLLLCTLYKNKDGKFQGKKSKIIIRQHKDGEKGEKTLGTCWLDLAENLSEDVAEFSKDLVLSLDKCADVDAELHLTIHSKPITAIKMESKDEERLSAVGSFSEGDMEAVDSLEDGPKSGLDDSLHEPHSPREKSHSTGSGHGSTGGSSTGSHSSSSHTGSSHSVGSKDGKDGSSSRGESKLSVPDSGGKEKKEKKQGWFAW